MQRTLGVLVIGSSRRLTVDLPLLAARNLFPGHPDRITVWRWITAGALARDGTRVKLEAESVPGRHGFLTSRAAVERFRAELLRRDAAYLGVAVPEPH